MVQNVSSAEVKSSWSHASTQLHTFIVLNEASGQSTSNMKKRQTNCHLTTVSSPRLYSVKWMISDYHTNSEVEWSGSDLIWSTIPAFAPMTEENHEKPAQLVCILAKNWTQHLPNKSQKCYNATGWGKVKLHLNLGMPSLGAWRNRWESTFVRRTAHRIWSAAP
jgi:hypothetical protein